MGRNADDSCQNTQNSVSGNPEANVSLDVLVLLRGIQLDKRGVLSFIGLNIYVTIDVTVNASIKTGISGTISVVARSADTTGNSIGC